MNDSTQPHTVEQNETDDVQTAENSGEDSAEDSGGLSEQEKSEIEKERAERLDPDNRPKNAEVDNTQRDFDPETGIFDDSDQDESDIEQGEVGDGLNREIHVAGEGGDS